MSFLRASIPSLIVFVLAMGGLCLSLSAQGLNQSVFGLVTDELTGEPLMGATITVKDSVKDISGKSDDKGKFKIDNVPPGRRVVKASLPGYASLTIPDVVIQTGRQNRLEIQLSQNVSMADSVIITASEISRKLIGPSTRVFTVEETRRYATTYFDPARLATSYPGVVATDDGANHISVRGNSPNGLKWRLEGVEIVNPNHLANGGTASDRPSLAGGGVNILSAQMLSTSRFLSGAFDARYGNALGGVMDVDLRSGNPTKDEYTLQFGLLGLDVAAEGPFGEKGKASFVGNYRYSTVGLLTQLGVDFGGEKINFQDLSFNFDLPTAKLGTFRVFGMGGTSRNLFEARRVADSLWSVQKDRSDITFRSRMGAAGISHKILLGKKTVWKTAFVASALQASRTNDYLVDTTTLVRVEEDEFEQSRMAFTTGLTHRFSPGANLQAGVYVTRLGYALASRVQRFNAPDSLRTRGAGAGNTLLLQPYARFRFFPTTKIGVEAGVHMMQLQLNGSMAIEPRGRIRYQLSDSQSVSLSYGLHSQVQPLSLYFSPVDSTGEGASYINRDLGFTRAHHVVLTFAHRYSDHLNFKIEPYFQYLFNVPIVNRPNSTFSALNLLEDAFITDTLSNSGTGMNYGVEVSAERTLSDGYYAMISANYYQSTFIGGDGVARSTRFNGEYGGAVTAGKEFYFNKEGKSRTLGIHTRFLYQGGFYTTPVDTAASQAAFRTVYQEDLAYSEKLPDYYRLDIRLAWTKNKPDLTRTIALELQNVLNTQNIAYRFFDPQAGEVITKFQLGLIPQFTYRLHF